MRNRRNWLFGGLAFCGTCFLVTVIFGALNPTPSSRVQRVVTNTPVRLATDAGQTIPTTEPTSFVFATVTRAALDVGATASARGGTETPLAVLASPVPSEIVGTATATVNIRAQPDRNAARLGQLKDGERIVLTGKTAAGDWYQFEKGWVIAEAIAVSGDVKVLAVVSAGAPSAAGTAVRAATVSLSTGCPEGCIERNEGCEIKGNVSTRNKNEKIYHTPGSTFYDKTDVNVGEGDRWFCTAAEAEANGFRAPK